MYDQEKTIINNMISRNRILYFFVILMALEIIQFYFSNEYNYRFGDFPITNRISLLALFFAIFSWFTAWLIFRISYSNRNGVAITLPNYLLLTIFIINFTLTLFTGLGSIHGAKSMFGFITTMFPINYMIMVIALDKGNRRIRPITYTLLISTDLVRLLFGAFLKIGFILFCTVKANKKMIVLTLIISFFAVPMAIEQKFKLRNAKFDSETILVQGLVSRIATTNTFDFVLDNAHDLRSRCQSYKYESNMVLFGLSVIPKSIFGILFPKSANNCFIETFLSRNVNDSSVNAPILSQYYMHFSEGINFRSIEFGAINLIALIIFIYIANITFGYRGTLFKGWVLFEYFWTGNILTLSIPIYFCVLMFVVSLIVRRLN